MKETIINQEQTIQQNQTQKIPENSQPIKNKTFTIKKLKQNNCTPFQTFTLLFPIQLIFNILQSGIDTMIVNIADSYNVEVTQVQWLSHASNLGICSFGIIANKLYSKFNVVNCYKVSALFSSIFLLGSFLFSKIQGLGGLIGLNIMYFFASAFVSQVFSGVVSMGNYFIKDKVYGIARALSYTDSVVPLGYFIGSLISGVLSQYSDWRYLFLIAFILNVLYTIYILVFTEHIKIQQGVKIDILSAILIMAAVSTTIIGVGLLNSFSENLQYIFIPIIILIISAVLFTLFVYRNKKQPIQLQIFRKEVLNENTINFVSFFFLFSIGSTSDNFFVPIIWRQLFNYSSIQNALLISLCKLIAFLFIRLYVYIINHVTTTYIQRSTTFIYTLVYIFQILQLNLFMNIYTTEISNILVSILFTQTQIAIQTYNVVGSPSQFGFISSSLIGFTGRFANSIGLGLSTSIQTISRELIKNESNNYIVSISISYGFGTLIVLISFFMALKIGVLRYEIGRLGYSEQKLDKTLSKSYEELKEAVVSDELVEVDINQEYSKTSSDEQSDQNLQ